MAIADRTRCYSLILATLIVAGVPAGASYSRDALGRRVTSEIGGVTARYYYDGQNVVEERDGSDAVVRYHVNGSQYVDERAFTYSDVTAQSAFYLLSRDFSVVGTGDTSGTAFERFDYTAWGDFRSQSSVPPSGTFTLHGRPIDVLESDFILIDCRARHYDPKNGRWLQRDPSGYADGNNLYESFGGNTVRFVDPSGRWMARRIAEILQEKGQINVGDIQQLAKELHSTPRSQITKLTEEEIALLSLIGGPAHGTPWTEANLSADLKKRADDEFAGLAAPCRYRAEATYLIQPARWMRERLVEKTLMPLGRRLPTNIGVVTRSQEDLRIIGVIIVEK